MTIHGILDVLTRPGDRPSHRSLLACNAPLGPGRVNNDLGSKGGIVMSFDYQAYLASREWSLKREAVRERSNNECERCWKAPQQAVHHLSYEHIGDEPLDELLAVCNPCHEWLSGKSNDDPAATRLGAVMFLPTRDRDQWHFFPDDGPRYGLRPRVRNETLPLSLFAYSTSVSAAIGDAWFVGYHVAEDSTKDESLVVGWYAPETVAALSGGFDGVAESIDDAWKMFLAIVTRHRRDDWRFVPDARFDIYGERAP